MLNGQRKVKKILNIFFNLEKRNYINKLITTLEIDEKIIKEPDQISQAQTDFYKNLYSERLNERELNYQASFNNVLDNNDIKKITTEQKEFCETEILKSIKNLNNGKTPGSYGLPTDFYNCFGQI